jgi:citrate lyase beta subunit
MPAWTDLSRSLQDDLDQRLAAADAELASRFPGDAAARQPVHTVYVPADRYHAGLAAAWGEQAIAALDAHADAYGELVGDDALVAQVREKLAREPIEDLRIDFEDGYGRRDDETEDADVDRAARDLARARSAGTGTPYAGIRFKSLEAPTRHRGVRTLTAFVATLLEAGGRVDEGFWVTLPKITSVDQVAAMVVLVSRLEEQLGLPAGSLRFELQIETPQSILGPDGTALVARMIQAGDGRVTALHYGTYDYSAFCAIPAALQSMEHPVADFAKLVMQAAAAGTGVRLSDGSTNVLPVGDPDDVRRAWTLHLRLVRRSLERGYYQGWDLHPAQLPTRFAATYAFYREGFAASAARLRAYLDLVAGHGDGAAAGIADEPATARALSDFIVRGLDCGALSSAEVAAATGRDAAELTGLARPGR